MIMRQRFLPLVESCQFSPVSAPADALFVSTSVSCFTPPADATFFFHSSPFWLFVTITWSSIWMSHVTNSYTHRPLIYADWQGLRNVLIWIVLWTSLYSSFRYSVGLNKPVVLIQFCTCFMVRTLDHVINFALWSAEYAVGRNQVIPSL